MTIRIGAPATGARPVLSHESTKTAWPTVSVIVPVYNGAADLEHCLAALANLDYPGLVQVIVADNASSDDPRVVVERHPGVRLVHEDRPGSYAARNTALKEALGEVVAFTDADCRPDSRWLREAVTALRATPTAAMVGGRISMSYRNDAPQTGSELYESVHGFPQQRYLADQHFAVTANMVTWRWVLDEIGHFDASLMSRGDAQWGQRVHAAGLLQRYAPEAVVVHPARATLGESSTKWWRVARGKVDNDLSAGRGPRHFAGLVGHQARTFWSSLRSPGAGLDVPSPVTRSKYLMTATLCRVVTTTAYLGGLVQSLRQSGGARA